MDDTRRPTDRWLHLLGIALLAEAAVGFLPGLRQIGDRVAAHAGFCTFAAITGGATLLAAWRRSSPTIGRGFLVAAFIAVAGVRLATHLQFWTPGVRFDSSQLFGMSSWSLIGFGAPVLWGSALARREDPQNAAALKAGRISAGAVQLGFVFLFASEVRTMAMFGFRGGMNSISFPGAAFGLAQALQLADRILLLWSSIEAVRTASDDDVIRRRASKIHVLMTWWVVLSVFADVGTQLIFKSQFGSPGSIWTELPHGFWRVVVVQSVAVAAALAVFCRLTVRKGADKSVVTGDPVPGAEA